MKHPFLIMLLASSTLFSIEKPSLWKQANQKLFGKYLITKARENNCPEVASLLHRLKNCEGTLYSAVAIHNFVTRSEYEAILRQDSEIEDIIRGTYLLKHPKLCRECNFAKLLLSIKIHRRWIEEIMNPNPRYNTIAITQSQIRSQIRSQIISEERRNTDKGVGIYSLVAEFSLEELLQKAEAKITAARSALAAAAEKEAQQINFLIRH